jgi:hypothetical protein
MQGDGSIAPSFSTSALDGSEWSVSRSGCFTPAERLPDAEYTGGWVGLTVGLFAVEKIGNFLPL